MEEVCSNVVMCEPVSKGQGRQRNQKRDYHFWQCPLERPPRRRASSHVFQSYKNRVPYSSIGKRGEFVLWLGKFGGKVNISSLQQQPGEIGKMARSRDLGKSYERRGEAE